MSVKKITVGTLSMSTISVLRIAAQFFVMPILARILSPHEYGIVSLAMPIIVILMIFADAGVGQSLIKEGESDTTTWSSAFWMTSGIGVVLTLLAVALSPLVAYAFGEAQLGPITRALSIVALLQAVCTVPGVFLQKRGRFTTIAVVEVISMFTGLGVALAAALMGAGVWALVMQQLAHYTVRTLLTFPLAGFRPAFRFNASALGEHIRFGRSMLANNLILNVSQSLELMIIGHMLGAAATGIFSMAFLFARLPMRLLAGPLNYVVYSHLIPFRDDPEKLRSAFLAITYVVACVVLSGLFVTAVAHREVFHLVLGAKWDQAALFFGVVAPFVAFQILASLTTTIRLVLGHAGKQMQMTVEFTTIWCVLLIATASYGLIPIGYAFGAAVLITVPRNIYTVLTVIQGRAEDYLRIIWLPLLTASAAALCYYALIAGKAYPIYVSLGAYTLLILASMGVSVLLGRSTLRKGAIALGT